MWKLYNYHPDATECEVAEDTYRLASNILSVVLLFCGTVVVGERSRELCKRGPVSLVQYCGHRAVITIVTHWCWEGFTTSCSSRQSVTEPVNNLCFVTDCIPLQTLQSKPRRLFAMLSGDGTGAWFLTQLPDPTRSLCVFEAIPRQNQ